GRDEIDFVDLSIDTLHVDRHRTLARTKLLLFVELNWSEGEILPVHGHMELMVFGIPDYVVEISFHANRHDGFRRGRLHLLRLAAGRSRRLTAAVSSHLTKSKLATKRRDGCCANESCAHISLRFGLKQSGRNRFV